MEREADKTYTSTTRVPKNAVGLLLGTSKFLSNGSINLHYKCRIKAATALYNAGKIEFILVSGDNGCTSYDEPTTMKNDLIAHGVPLSRIYLDYAGFRTLDSVVRSKEIFGQSRVTVISQQFHNERAIFLANWFGINAVGFNAQNVSYRYGLKTKIRERLARVKMMVDLFVGTQPKFGGPPVSIN